MDRGVPPVRKIRANPWPKLPGPVPGICFLGPATNY
jgi:hypothetical protein